MNKLVKKHIHEPDKTRTVVLPENLDLKRSKLSYTREPLMFVLRYYRSPAFNARLLNLKIAYPIIYKKYNPDSEYRTLLKWTKSPLELIGFIDNKNGEKENASYDKRFSIISIGNHSNPDEYDSVIAHELGHAVDNSIRMETGMPGYFSNNWSRSSSNYSGFWPIFRKSASYLDAKNEVVRDGDVGDGGDLFDRNPEAYYSLYHDAAPSESYADLMRVRYLLDKYRIYDSTKTNNPFTLEHLNKLKEKVPNNRLYDNFSDDEIIEMMNTVAYNTSRKNKPLYYAKSGLKFKRGGQILKALFGSILDFVKHPILHTYSYLSGLFPPKKDYKNTIYINKGRLRLYYYDKNGDIKINSPISTGAKPGLKLKEGDLRTPEGEFKISYVTDTADKNKFGDTLFYGLSYGNGIGIHGDAGSPDKLGRPASHGCIRLPNGLLRCLLKEIGTGVGIPVIIDKYGGKLIKRTSQ